MTLKHGRNFGRPFLSDNLAFCMKILMTFMIFFLNNDRCGEGVLFKVKWRERGGVLNSQPKYLIEFFKKNKRRNECFLSALESYSLASNGPYTVSLDFV